MFSHFFAALYKHSFIDTFFWGLEGYFGGTHAGGFGGATPARPKKTVMLAALGRHQKPSVLSFACLFLIDDMYIPSGK